MLHVCCVVRICFTCLIFIFTRFYFAFSAFYLLFLFLFPHTALQRSARRGLYHSNSYLSLAWLWIPALVTLFHTNWSIPECQRLCCCFDGRFRAGCGRCSGVCVCVCVCLRVCVTWLFFLYIHNMITCNILLFHTISLCIFI